jgi:serine/threonine protein kinase
LDKDDKVIICDFGISKKLTKNELLSGTSGIYFYNKGTPNYVSPEAIKEKNYSGKEADIWALGITLYNLTFEELPFHGNSFMEVFTNITENDIKFPEKKINGELKNMISRILVKDPELRIGIEEIKNHPWLDDKKELIDNLQIQKKKYRKSLKEKINDMISIKRNSFSQSKITNKSNNRFSINVGSDLKGKSDENKKNKIDQILKFKKKLKESKSDSNLINFNNKDLKYSRIVSEEKQRIDSMNSDNSSNVENKNSDFEIEKIEIGSNDSKNIIIEDIHEKKNEEKSFKNKFKDFMEILSPRKNDHNSPRKDKIVNIDSNNISNSSKNDKKKISSSYEVKSHLSFFFKKN